MPIKFIDTEEDFKFEKELKKNRVFLVLIIFFIVLLVFLGRAFYLQTVRGKHFSERLNNISKTTEWDPSQRGLIYSKDGEVLAKNRVNFSLVVLPSRILKLSQKEKEEYAKRLDELLNVSKDNILKKFKKATDTEKRYIFDPYPITKDLTRKELLKLEMEVNSMQGVDILKNYYRHYPYNDLFAHLLGYTGSVDEEDVKNKGYLPIDKIGKSGIEKSFEHELKGEHGYTTYRLLEGGSQREKVATLPPKPGKDITLSINKELQKATHNALEDKIKDIESSDAGAALALDVDTGKILSFVSYPDYNPNSIVSGSEKEREDIFSSSDNILFNRIISGMYQPGSTFKMVMAAAAIEENAVDPEKTFDIPPEIKVENKYNPDIVYTYKDWKDHGHADLRRALAVSSNVYFYLLGGGHEDFPDIDPLGIDTIRDYSFKLGLGEKTNINLDNEKPGFIPSPAWKQAFWNKPWVKGDTYNTAIGQGFSLVTPIQLARLTAAIGNGGDLYKPLLVNKVGSKKREPKIQKKGVIKDSTAEIIREGMRQAVTDGYTQALKELEKPVAAKTGTAQIKTNKEESVEPHGWVATLLPADNPKIAVVVLVENGIGGSTSAVPVAKEVLKKYLTLQKD